MSPHVTIDGREVPFRPGDTVAAALLRAGVRRSGDSIYRGRPRGIVAAGVEEPNAFVQVLGGPGQADYEEPMVPVTTLEARDGLRLRWLTGIGVLDQRPDPARYDKAYIHTDVAVVGSGPAGLAAAREAARGGARVVLFEQDFRWGGSLIGGREAVEGRTADDWIADQVRALEAEEEVRLLPRTAVVGSYDNNYLVALQRLGEGGSGTRQRLWHVTAAEVVLATGAHERPLIFPDNDRPGVMLASAVATYLRRYGVAPAGPVVIAATGDDAYPLAAELAAEGAQVSVVDARPAEELSAAAHAVTAGLSRHRTGAAVAGTTPIADGTLGGVVIAPIDADGNPGATEEWRCATLAVAGGWSPVVHLHSQRQGPLAWDPDLQGFVPTAPVANQHLAGAVAGTYSSNLCVREGKSAGSAAARAAGWPAGQPSDRAVDSRERTDAAGARRALWAFGAGEGNTHFVDLQRDSTLADLARASGAGMRSVEHVKRYTSIGTGADQGKTSGVATIGALASRLAPEDLTAVPGGQPGQAGAGASAAPDPGSLGTTTYRAPFTPVAFAALAGRSRGELYDPVRVSAAHDWHVAHGAVFEDVGQWKRPRYYPQPGEDMDAAVARECRAARESVAFMDASTLGKIDIRGADAPKFLGRIYTNGFAKLAVGKGRYGMMCTPDGMVFDDGVSLRLAEDRYLMTTTTGGAAKVLEWLEEWHQTEWPDLDVTFTSVTEQWAVTAVVGPRSRDVVARLAPDLDVSAEGFGFMEFRETRLASGIWARIARITFSGELAFEISVPTTYGAAVVEQVAEAGADLTITPYGTETMHVLRAEKAYPIVGQDTDGTVTPQDLGMEWLVSKVKDFVGKRSYLRAPHEDPDRKQWVSVLPKDPELVLPEGAQIVAADALGDWDGTGLPEAPIPMLGHVTSSYRSQALGRSFGLALVKGGRARIGEAVLASFGGSFAEVEIGPTVLFDPEGKRRDG